MSQEQEKKMLSQSTYEGLCRKACANPEKPERGETAEDAYWRAIYRDVSRYLFPASPVAFQPMANVSLKDKYQFHLRGLVDKNKKGTFNPIDIATRFINEAMGKEEV
jgi:hypothetical protein